MNFQQAEKLLRKINMLFESLEADDEVSTIERDLMRDHLRRLYDLFQNDPTEKEATRRPAPRQQPKVEVLKKAPPKARRPAPPPAPAPTPEPAYEPPRIIELDEELQEMAATPPPAPPKPRPAPTPAAKPKSAPVSVELDDDIAALFQLPKGSDVAAKLGSSRITDLNRAMGLNERFLTRDELFGGSDAAMKNTLQTLNGFDNFAEAKQHLATKVIPKYGWTEKDKRKKAQVFIKLVSRRYV